MSQTKAQLIEGLNINTSAPADALSIDSSGQVGIGTTSPTTKLHVQQSAVSSAPSRSAALYLENNANCEIQFVGNASNDCQLRFGTTSNSFKGALEYELDNNNLKAYTNGSERLRIDSSGNVGIGITSPTEFVDIRKDQNAFTWAQIQNQNTSSGAYAGIQFGANGNTWGLANGSSAANSNSLVFVLDAGGTNSEKMRIDTQGRLLAGTTSSSVAARAIFQASSGGSGGGILILSRGTSTPSNNQALGELYFSDSGHVASASVDAKRDGGTWTSGSSQPTALVFQTTADGAASKAERMRIDSSGNVGIGNTSPSNYSSTGRNLVVGTGSSAAGLTVASGATNTGNIYFAAGSTGDDQVRGQIRYNHSTEAMDLYTDASLRMRIDGSGNVGIGTSSPSSLLQVNKNSTSAASGGLRIATADSNESLLELGISTSLDKAFISSLANGSGSVRPIDFICGSSSSDVRMRIASGGNVGINSTSPQSFGLFVVRNSDNRYTAIESSGKLVARYDDNSASHFNLLIRNTGITSVGHSANIGFYLGQSGTAKNGGIISSVAESNYSSDAHSDAALAFSSASNNANNEVFRITSDKYLRMNSGSSGVQFGGDTAAANALSDYEEGTFTPSTVLTYNPGGRSITDNGTGTGKYVKVGKIVYCEFSTGYTAISGSGNFNVGVNGLPFSADTTLRATGGAGRSNINGYMFILEDVNTTQVGVLRRYDNGGPVDGADNFVCHLTYITT